MLFLQKRCEISLGFGYFLVKVLALEVSNLQFHEIDDILSILLDIT